MSIFSELKRRNVFRVVAAYVVTAWLVIQVVETILPAFGFGDAAIRVVTIVFAIGLAPTAVLAWIFELTPEGVRRERDIDRSQPATGRGKALDRVIIIVLIAALAFFAFDYFVLDPRREAALEAQRAEEVAQARAQARSETLRATVSEKSIAVLAFRDMSPGGDQEYLADGIAEELLNLLAQVREIRVIARSSAFSYKGKDMKLSQIAGDLGVSHILEGSLRTSGERVRITAQLIEARTDTQLWSRTYDRKLDDIFAIQDEIAADVVQELEINLLAATPKARKTAPEAYALYLRARELGQIFTADTLDQSDMLYRRVIEIDPDYPSAWIGIASNVINRSGLGLLSNEETTRMAREAASKALAIDPQLGPAQAMLGWSARRDNDLPGAARYYERALALTPHDINVLNGSAVLLTALGRLEEALALQRAVVGRNPINETARFNLGIAQYRNGHFDEAVESLRQVIRMNPARSIAHYSIGAAMLLSGNARDALFEFEQETSEIWRLLGLPMAHHALGRKSESEAALEALIAKFGDRGAYNIAYVHAFMGEADLAFEWLERELELTGPAMPTIVAEPLFRNIHSDPRWAEFLRKIGKAPEQLAAIEFKVTVPNR